jgi:hypothetical protein
VGKQSVRRARERGFDRVRLVQTPCNCLTMALYSKAGFDVTERLVRISGLMLAPKSADRVETGSLMAG